MKLLYNMLKEFVDVTDAPDALRSRLSLSGLSVDSIEETAAGPLLDAEVTINRPDCMGHYGVAREVSTAYRLPLKKIEPKIKEAADAASSAARVTINSPELCGRFTARVMRGVKVQPSPAWLRDRLVAMGQASINNVVDATNYVMLELGQPMHAYDLDKLSGHEIIVRRAAAEEKIKTLDGIDRVLTADICVIADGSRALGIAGVMGGQDSEIGFATHNILLEAAWFDAISVRRTSKALQLRTEASTRFERGSDPEMAELASRRCAELIQQLAGGEVLSGVVDIYPAPPKPGNILLARRELWRVMGADVPDADVEIILGSLGFAPRRADKMDLNSPEAVWQCTQPSWRPDVTREIDLIEEVVRHYGLDKFKARMPVARTTAARLPNAEIEDRLRERLSGLGYQEILTIPLVDPARDSIFRADSDVPVQIANPLAEDASVMRTTGISGMLGALEWNLNRGQKNLRLFEISRAYRWNGAVTEELPILTIGATGMAHEKSVAEAPREFSFADLKGDLDRLGELAGGFQWNTGAPTWLHSARSGTIAIGNYGSAHDKMENAYASPPAVAGQLSRGVAEKLKLRQEIFLGEILLNPFYSACDAARKSLRYSPVSKYQSVERDFSLVLNDGATFAQVSGAVRALGIEELMSVEAVDVFRGGNVPPGQFSLLVRVTFQSAASTLTDAQLNHFSTRIAEALHEKLGAALRTT
jgi:phenylalanyl-tRNA synthetase beta chain